MRHGCILSPILFNIYLEFIFREAFEDFEAGILVNGQRLNNIRYADDTVVFTDNPADLQHLMSRIAGVSQQYGLDINVDKTKLMVISKDPVPHLNLNINGVNIARVNKYVHLGTVINDQWDSSVEVRCRIKKARSVFNRMATP